MILHIITDKKEIPVLFFEIAEKIYKSHSVKTLKINDNYYLTKRDKIEYSCDQCKKIETQIFKFADKFFNEKILCTECYNKIHYGTAHPLQSKIIIDKRKQTNIEKYGFENVFQSEEVKKKSKKTLKQKYGVENINQNKEIREKIKTTNLRKYGVPYPMMDKEIQKKSEKTCLKKYGVNKPNKIGSDSFKNKMISLYGKENASQILEIIKKRRQYFIQEYGGPSPFYNKSILQQSKNTSKKNRIEKLPNSEKLNNYTILSDIKKDFINNNSILEFQCKKCNTIFIDTTKFNHPRCPTCYPKIYMGVSKIEKELYDWIISLGIKASLNDYSIIAPKELDIYIPNHNLAIEFDGLYWHSELQGKYKNYHLNKTNLCLEKGINLIHIFEDEWIEKQEIIKSIIKSKLGLYDQIIYGRKCKIKEINSKQTSDFYNINHLQGEINSSVNLGLFYNNELVSCLSFAKPRFNKKYDWEITRFANKLNTKVIGSFAKLFKQRPAGSIITYSDKRLFTGEIYKNNGFKQLKDSSPSYYYTNYLNKFSRVQFQKHKLNKLLESFDSNLTEWENMQLNGYDRIWDCGNYVFELV